MACGDVLSLEDLQTAKKHQIFEAEVITGKVDGVAGGADIDYATNQVTGQTQKTLPAVLRDAGFRPASFTFATGGTLEVGDSDVAVLWPVSSGGDGQYYIWKGAYPKVIPAASSPATTGGVSDAGWMPLGDVALRGDLSASDGATLVGLTPQNWSGLVGASTFDRVVDLWSNAGISYENMGAVLDGVADDTAAVVAAHSLAKSLGLKVRQHGGVAKVSGATPIEFATDCEFTGGFKFLFNNPGTGFLFDVTPEYTPIELTQANITIGQFTKGATQIASLSNYAYHYAVIESSEVALTRLGGGQQLKKCVTAIGENGRLLYPLTFGFGSITKITLSPYNIPQREISGLAFEINGSGQFALPIRQKRNNVNYVNTRYIEGNTTGAIPVRQIWTLLNCFRTRIQDPIADTLSLGRVDYNYVINGDGCAGLMVDGMLSFEGWAQIDGNNCRDVKVRDSAIYRVGGHFNCWDYSFDNITAHNTTPISITGGGMLNVNGIKLCPSALTGSIDCVVDIRQDYGAQWDGSISVTNVDIDLTNVTSAANLEVVRAYMDSSTTTHDFGSSLVFPRKIVVENVNILLNEANANKQNIRAVLVGCYLSLGGSRATVYPAEISVSKITKIKAAKNVNNEVSAVLIVGTNPPLGVSNEMFIHVDNVNRNDPRLFSLNPYDPGQTDTISVANIPNIEINVSVENCRWLRVQNSAKGRTTIKECLVAAISGSGHYEMFNCQYPATSFSGTWKGLMAGGVIRRYVGTDSNLKQVGFPNNIENNIVAARGVFVEKDGNIRSITQTISTIQTGFYDTNYYTAP